MSSSLFIEWKRNFKKKLSTWRFCQSEQCPNQNCSVSWSHTLCIVSWTILFLFVTHLEYVTLSVSTSSMNCKQHDVRSNSLGETRQLEEKNIIIRLNITPIKRKHDQTVSGWRQKESFLSALRFPSLQTTKLCDDITPFTSYPMV